MLVLVVDLALFVAICSAAFAVWSHFDNKKSRTRNK